MGYGGSLIWTAVARNLKQKYPGKKLVFVYRHTWKDFLLCKGAPHREIYLNNPDMDMVIDQRLFRILRSFLKKEDLFVVDMHAPGSAYWEGDCRERYRYKKGKHAIEFACEFFGIEHPVLRCRVVLSQDEEARVKALLEAHSLQAGHYICIEPQATMSCSSNKEWFPDRWQELVDRLGRYFAGKKMEMKIVQIGPRGGRILDGVIDLTGETTFREAGGVLEKARTYIGYMGGLVHLAKGFGKTSVVLVSGFEPLGVGSYPDDINLYSEMECSGCGLKEPCPKGRECMRRISVQDVFQAVMRCCAEK